jgi:hypothetical protein
MTNSILIEQQNKVIDVVTESNSNKLTVEQAGKLFVSGLAEPFIAGGLLLLYDMYLNPTASPSIVKVPYINIDLKEQYIHALACAGTIGVTNLANKFIMPMIFPRMMYDSTLYNLVQSISPATSVVSGTLVSYGINYVQRDFGKVPNFNITGAEFKTHLNHGLKYGMSHLISRNLNDTLYGSGYMLYNSFMKK